MIHKIYPSSFAEPTGTTTVAKYSNGCPRYEAFKGHIPIEKRGSIPAVYSMIGTLTEEYVKAILTPEETAELKTEVSIERDLGDGVWVRGRADLVIGDRHIYEIKGTISKNKRSSIVTRGVVDPGHLGQIVTYMSEMKIKTGTIIVVYWHFNKERTALLPEPRRFEIELDQNVILVDGNPYQKSVMGMLGFYRIIKDALIKPELPPATAVAWACKTCPFHKICAKAPKDKDDFIRYIEHDLDETKLSSSHTPTIASHNARK